MGYASAEIVLAPLSQSVRRDRVGFIALMLAASLAAGLFLQQVLAKPIPLSLSLHETAGQLRIGWSARAAAQGATLEILDGSRQTTLQVAPPLADVTYAARTTDVQVRLTSTGGGQTEITRYLVREPSIADLQAQYVALLKQAHALRSAIGRQNARISHLQSGAQTVARRLDQPHAKLTHPKPSETRWWR